MISFEALQHEPVRCVYCAWPVKETMEDGCSRGSCSQRPRPAFRPDIVEQNKVVEALRELREARALLREGSDDIFCADEYLELGGKELSDWIQRVDALLDGAIPTGGATEGEKLRAARERIEELERKEGAGKPNRSGMPKAIYSKPHNGGWLVLICHNGFWLKGFGPTVQSAVDVASGLEMEIAIANSRRGVTEGEP